MELVLCAFTCNKWNEILVLELWHDNRSVMSGLEEQQMTTAVFNRFKARLQSSWQNGKYLLKLFMMEKISGDSKGNKAE